MRFWSILIFLIGSISLWSQTELEPVKWQKELKHIENDIYELTFTASIDKGWTVYSQFTQDNGPYPTEVTYESDHFELLGQSQESGHKKEGYDKIFEVDVIKYLDDQPFVIKQKLKLQDVSKPVVGYLTFMTCDSGRCLPPTDVEFSLLASKEQSGIIGDAGNAQLKEPVKWTVDIKDLVNNEYELSYTADIEEGWTVYSQFTNDDGPVPTMITYENEDVVSLIGKATETGHKKEGYDKIFELDVIKFLADQPYTIKQKVKANSTEILSGYLTYMTCNSESCLPPTDVDFKFNLETGSVVDLNKSNALASSSPNISGNFLDQSIENIQSSLKSPVADCGEEQVQDASHFWSFILGFGGGLLALLTPCVFPMIPLTVSFFTKDTKRKGWVNGLIYGLSIVVIYVTLGLLITGLFGGEALNRLSTNWIANTLFFIIFVVFALSFFGYFEITLPSSWTTKSDAMADKGGFLGIFFMAFTLALVSFSCTGPIIGSAIVQSATSTLGPFIVMLGFSLALALPFGFFAAFPAWLNSLPSSGSWMNSVKVVLGFLELALAFKFLSVADMTNHWGFLRYELFMGLWVIIFAGMALYLFGVIKFPHDSPVKKLSLPRIGLAGLTVAFVLYLMSGFMFSEKAQSYNALKLMSGLAPPTNYNFFLPEPAVDEAIKSKYPSFTKCANNINCFKDYYEGLSYAREVGKPVFLDFTGYGCVNCRKTEEHIWVKDEIRMKLNEDFVLVSLYVDDDKALDDVYVSKVREGKKIRNVGNKWADFQIVNFKQNSQPLYVMMDVNEQVLSLPRGYKEGADDYLEFLECGLKAHGE